MLTEEDIKKLKEELTTKKDLKKFATREDLENSTVKILSATASKEELKDLKQDVDGLREAIQTLIASVDKLVKSVEDIHQEYVAMIAKVDRHEKWINQIAEKLGIKLEY